MRTIVTIVVIVGFLLLLANPFYKVNETEQIIITQFGKPVGEPVREAGLKLKLPFVQQANPIEKRILEWDGKPSNICLLYTSPSPRD